MKCRRLSSKQFALMMPLAFLAAMVSWLLATGKDAHWVTPNPAKAISEPRLLAAYGRLPLTFELNQGQTDPQVQFLSRGQGYALFLGANEAVLALSKAKQKGERIRDRAVVRMKLVGANPTPEATGMEELPGKVNYFVGNDPAQWRTNVATYAKVRYEEVYSGVDLVYYGNQQQLEYDFVVAPGADPKAIELQFGGADKLEVDAQGDLVLHLGQQQARFHKPLLYQEMGGQRQQIAGSYLLRDQQRVGFTVAAYDPARPLIIDPVLSYSTYLGGSGWEWGVDIAVDSSGNAYVTGYTDSADFPTVNPIQATVGGGDLFVAKLNAAGSSLVYSTFLGGSGNDEGGGIAVDTSGNAYVTGYTYSPDFPTINAFQPVYGNHGQAYGGSGDGFVLKLNATGSALVYCTYLGGSGFERAGGDTPGGGGIAVDSSGNAYVTGVTGSTDFPTANPLQGALKQFIGGDGNLYGYDAFVTKLNPTGSALVYSTYLGGTYWDWAPDIAVDAAGNAYIAGETRSADFPIANAFQGNLRGDVDGFVAKVNSSGSALVYSTYLGGTGYWERATSVAVDSSGNAYVTGVTTSPDFPIANALQASLGSNCSSNAFVTKLDATGSALVYSTYLGGSNHLWAGNCGSDTAEGITVDSSGNAYIIGETWSTDFPTVNPLQTSGYMFVSKLNAAGSALLYSTYFGNDMSDMGSAIAVDSSGNAYIIGMTWSTSFPTASPLQTTYGGGSDAFVAKIADSPAQAIQQVIQGVIDLNLKAGIESSLDSKLDAASQALTDANQNNNVAAINSLQAFTNSVQAQRGVQISTADADALIAAAQAIIAQLQGP